MLQMQSDQLVLRTIWPWLPTNLSRDNYGGLAGHLTSKVDSLVSKTSLPLTTVTEMLGIAKESSTAYPSVLVASLRQKLLLHPNHSVHNAERLAESLIDAWITTKVTLPGNQALVWQPSVTWHEDKLLSVAVEDAFEQLKSQDRDGPETASFSGEIPKHLTIEYLTRNHGWAVRWSSNLLGHLTVDRVSGTITIYEHKIALVNHLRDVATQRFCPIPQSVLEEALDTLNILFPPENASTQNYLRSCQRPFHSNGMCGRPEQRDIGKYVYWQRSLALLVEELKKPRRGLRQLTVNAEQGNLIEVATFWIAAMMALTLAIAFGVSATYFAAKSFKIGEAQYYLALAQACATPGANESLPQYCR